MGCDLSNKDLLDRDLLGINLEGADLTCAVKTRWFTKGASGLSILD